MSTLNVEAKKIIGNSIGSAIRLLCDGREKHEASITVTCVIELDNGKRVETLMVISREGSLIEPNDIELGIEKLLESREEK